MTLTRQAKNEPEQPHVKTAIARDLALRVLEFLPVGVVVADLNGYIQYINAAYSTMFGYRLADIQAKRLHDFALPDQQQVIDDALELRSQGAASSYRYQLYRQDGTVADVELSGTPYRDTDGMILGKVAIVRDISEELALERATFEARRAINKKITDSLIQTKRSLEQEKNSALEILEMLQDGFALLDLAGKIEYANPAFGKMFLMQPALMIGLEAGVFLQLDDFANLQKTLHELPPRSVVTYQHHIRQPSGDVFAVTTRANFRYDNAGIAKGLLLMMRDVSHELESRAKMQQLEIELQNFTNNLKVGIGFSGRLEHIGGATGLMQMLKDSGIAGVVQFDDSEIYLRHGRIVSIVHPGLSGTQAARVMMQRQHGQFQFMPNLHPSEQDLDLDPTKIALELLVEQDQQNNKQPSYSEQQVILPNSAAAHGFLTGVGGRQQFTVGQENGKVVITGRGLRIVVLQGQPEDF